MIPGLSGSSVRLIDRRGDNPSSANRGKLLPFFRHQLSEFFDAELRDQKFDPRPRAVALLAEPSEHARDRLQGRQQFFFGQKLIEQFRLVRHRAQTAADVEREAALLLAIDDSGLGDGAHVVHGHQAARVLLATGKSDFHFAPEVLGVRMAH